MKLVVLFFTQDDDFSHPPMATGGRSEPTDTPPASPWVRALALQDNSTFGRMFSPCAVHLSHRESEKVARNNGKEKQGARWPTSSGSHGVSSRTCESKALLFVNFPCASPSHSAQSVYPRYPKHLKTQSYNPSTNERTQQTFRLNKAVAIAHT